ncbi:MAG: hypothetical protein ACI8W7_000792 [Gammaproteobacteria bacterium]|jgi:hypothetical protein
MIPTRPFKPGFRIDAVDTLVLFAGATGTVLLAQGELWWMGLIIGFTVGHFFIFCNVFRVARRLELTWSAIFSALAGSTIISGQPGWVVTLGATLLATLVVIVMQVRKPSYHGIAWQRFNPRLREWWDAQDVRSDNR